MSGCLCACACACVCVYVCMCVCVCFAFNIEETFLQHHTFFLLQIMKERKKNNGVDKKIKGKNKDLKRSEERIREARVKVKREIE